MIIDLLSNEGLFVIIKHEYEYCEWVVNNIYMNDLLWEYYQSERLNEI